MNDGGPVFPNEYNMSSESGKCEPVGRYGLSIRDYFAAKAMASLVASYRTTMRGIDDARKESDADLMAPSMDMILDKNSVTGEYDGSNEIASGAYIIADAMLAAREQKGEGK